MFESRCIVLIFFSFRLQKNNCLNCLNTARMPNLVAVLRLKRNGSESYSIDAVKCYNAALRL